MRLVLLLPLSACSPFPMDDTAQTEDTDDTDTVAPEWGYGEEDGPAHWGELSEEWETCGTGTAQSPIDIDVETILYAGSEPVVSWGTTSLRAYNPGHYIRYEVDPGGTLTVDGLVYDLVQFHFHGLSEHTVGGEHFDAEIHFVHTNPDPAHPYAVIAVFADVDDVGDPSDAMSPGGALKFDEALALPESEEVTELGGTIDLATAFGSYWGAPLLQYTGSLTTPPCTEGVTFLLSGDGMVVPAADMAAFHEVYDFNYRPVQPLNGRTITTPALE